MPLSFTSCLLLLASLPLYLSFPADVCGRGRCFFNRSIQWAYSWICSCMWSITSTIWKRCATLDSHFRRFKAFAMTHHLLQKSKDGNPVGNHSCIHRNPRQFTWCSFNLIDKFPKSKFSQLTHCRHFQLNLVQIPWYSLLDSLQYTWNLTHIIVKWLTFSVISMI